MRKFKALLCLAIFAASLSTSGCGLRIDPEFGFNCLIVCFGEEKDNSGGLGF
ncbi:MAG: hypothetical protein P8176_12955 [Gammaproteobacteria bacterium]